MRTTIVGVWPPKDMLGSSGNVVKWVASVFCIYDRYAKFCRPFSVVVFVFPPFEHFLRFVSTARHEKLQSRVEEAADFRAPHPAKTPDAGRHGINMCLHIASFQDRYLILTR